MSMKLCEDRHEPVVFEDWNHNKKKHNPCPVCEALDQAARLEEEIDELRAELKEVRERSEQ